MIELEDYEIQVIEKDTGIIIDGREAELIAKSIILSEVLYKDEEEVDKYFWKRRMKENPKLAAAINKHILNNK